jgi:hypothetical protein
MAAGKEAPEEPGTSRAAGGCVLLGVVSGAVAAVFAVSPAVGVLGLWIGGAVLLWRTVRRGVSDSSAPPPPPPETPPGDVYADETPVVDRVERGPEGVTCTIHVKRTEVRFK